QQEAVHGGPALGLAVSFQPVYQEPDRAQREWSLPFHRREPTEEGIVSQKAKAWLLVGAGSCYGLLDAPSPSPQPSSLGEREPCSRALCRPRPLTQHPIWLRFSLSRGERVRVRGKCASPACRLTPPESPPVPTLR